MKKNKPDYIARNPPDKTIKEEWLKYNVCRFCVGSRLHTCTGYDCRRAIEKAEEIFEKDSRRAVSMNGAVGSNGKERQEG